MMYDEELREAMLRMPRVGSPSRAGMEALAKLRKKADVVVTVNCHACKVLVANPPMRTCDACTVRFGGVGFRQAFCFDCWMTLESTDKLHE